MTHFEDPQTCCLDLKPVNTSGGDEENSLWEGPLYSPSGLDQLLLYHGGLFDSRWVIQSFCELLKIAYGKDKYSHVLKYVRSSDFSLSLMDLPSDTHSLTSRIRLPSRQPQCVVTYKRLIPIVSHHPFYVEPFTPEPAQERKDLLPRIGNPGSPPSPMVGR